MISLHGASNNHGLIEYWRAAFAPLPRTMFLTFNGMRECFFDIFSFPVGLALTGIAGVAAVVGADEFRRRADLSSYGRGFVARLAAVPRQLGQVAR